MSPIRYEFTNRGPSAQAISAAAERSRSIWIERQINPSAHGGNVPATVEIGGLRRPGNCDFAVLKGRRGLQAKSPHTENPIENTALKVQQNGHF
jgi:hypothetical protein